MFWDFFLKLKAASPLKLDWLHRLDFKALQLTNCSHCNGIGYSSTVTASSGGNRSLLSPKVTGYAWAWLRATSSCSQKDAQSLTSRVPTKRHSQRWSGTGERRSFHVASPRWKGVWSSVSQYLLPCHRTRKAMAESCGVFGHNSSKETRMQSNHAKTNSALKKLPFQWNISNSQSASHRSQCNKVHHNKPLDKMFAQWGWVEHLLYDKISITLSIRNFLYIHGASWFHRKPLWAHFYP